MLKSGNDESNHENNVVGMLKSDLVEERARRNQPCIIVGMFKGDYVEEQVRREKPCIIVGMLKSDLDEERSRGKQPCIIVECLRVTMLKSGRDESNHVYLWNAKERP